jgi:hypothetical protein
MSTISQITYSNLLRNTLRGNAVFSTVSGLAFTLFGTRIAEFIGLENVNSGASIITTIGVGLIGFAIYLLWASNQSGQSLANHGKFAIAGDLIWVLASWVIILGNLVAFSTAGTWAVAIVAEIVFVFAVVQYFGVRRFS